MEKESSRNFGVESFFGRKFVLGKITNKVTMVTVSHRKLINLKAGGGSFVTGTVVK